MTPRPRCYCTAAAAAAVTTSNTLTMDLLFALAMPFIGSQGRARFRRTLQDFRDDDESSCNFSTDGFPFRLDDEDAEELGSAALCSSHIEHFHLDVSGMTVDGTTTLVPFLERSAKLHCIKLEGSLETADQQRLTAQVTNLLLDAVRKNNTLQTCKLTSTHFGSAVFKRLLQSDLKNLVLVDCWRQATTQMREQMAKAFAENTALIDIALASLSNELLAAILESLKDHKSVQKLHLGSLQGAATGQAVRELLDSDTRLSELDLCGTEFNAENLQPVVGGLISSKTVHSFSISHCRLDASAVRVLKSLFRSSNDSLHHVNLSETISTATMLKDILDSFHRNTTVTLLDISSGGFDESASVAAQHMKALLRRNRHLKRLDIDRNTLGYSGAVAIAEGLRQNRTLDYLDCSGCELRDSGSIQIMDASHNLSHLIMCGNHMGLAAVQHFCQRAVAFHGRQQPQPRHKLLHLVLNGNNIGDEGALQLGALLKMHLPVLKALHVDHCGLTGTGFAAIMLGLHQQPNSSLTHFSSDDVNLAGPEDTSEAFCGSLVQVLPECPLQGLSVTVSEARSSRPTAQQQKDVLQAFDRNTTLVDITVGSWLLSAEQRKKNIAYCVLRNQILPHVHKDEESDDSNIGNNQNDTTEHAESASGTAAAADDDDDDYFNLNNKKKRKDATDDKKAFPRILWPDLLSKILHRGESAGASAAFFALQSRPDVLITDNAEAPSPRKKRRRS